MKRIFFVLALLFLLSPTRVRAQTAPVFEQLNIELWSEYDQPSVLVIQEFVVSQNTILPQPVAVRFPEGSNLIAVAVDNEGNLLNIPFETQPASQGWQTVTITVDSYNPYRVEYYQPLTREGNSRTFSFTWTGDYETASFNLTVLLPKDSTAIQTSPAINEFKPDPSGLGIFGTISQQNVTVGQSIPFEISYTRPSDDLIAPPQGQSIQPSEPLSTETNGRMSVEQLPWLIGGVGLALIALALSTYWRSIRGNENTQPAPRARSKRQSQQVYCQECGVRANPGDRFCRSCGSKLRAG